MRRIQSIAAAAFALLALTAPVRAQGTIPIALQQSVNNVGQPLAGCLLYIYQVGTVSTPQNVFSDPALTQTIANPLQCDQNGRLPMFYLASGSVKVRLTDSSGLVQFEYPSMLVIGPAGGSGGGGGVIDPTSIASTGDTKFRPTGELLQGWVKLNNTTIGPPTSGASQRANNDTQNLFTYLWNNCASPSSNTHCVVSGGLGANANADWQSGTKTITMPDWRSRGPLGLADMGGTSCVGVRTDCLSNASITSGGGDTAVTPGATGGESFHALTQAQLPNVTWSVNTFTLGIGTLATGIGTLGISDTRTWNTPSTNTGSASSGVALASAQAASGGVTTSVNSGSISLTGTPGLSGTPGFTGAWSSGGSNSPFNVLSPFMLGTWYMKL
jgi:hypothetical protein